MSKLTSVENFSSVEWLAKQLLNAEPNILEWQKFLLLAKEMHKKEIMSAHYAGMSNYIGGNFDFFQDDNHYYNEMFY